MQPSVSHLLSRAQNIQSQAVALLDSRFKKYSYYNLSKFFWFLNMKLEFKGINSVCFSSVSQSNSLQPHGLQHARLPCPSTMPRTCSNSCPLSQWCHLTITSSVIPFSSCLQSFPELGSFPVSQFFTLEFQLQHQSLQWVFSTDFLWDWLVWSPCSPRDSQDSSLTFHGCNHHLQWFGRPPKKVWHCFHCFPIYFPWSDGTRCHDLLFWMLSFKPTFSLSSFTFIKRLFSSSSLSAISVVSSAYLRLLIFLPAILIPACASSSPAFCMMYSAYKLNK